MQEPTVSWVPEYVDDSLGQEAVAFCSEHGLELDPWQAFTLATSLNRREDGLWAAFEVGLVLPRQNGKDGTVEGRELVGMFLVKERLIIHSAHQFDTSLEHFRRLLWRIEENPDLDKEVKRVSRSHGEEGIELKNGCRIRFRTRTKGGGRGFTGDLLIYNEAMDLPVFSHGALLPTLSARPNPQVWYTGSAVDQEIMEDGVVLARIRERGHAGKDPALAYFEWSATDNGLTPDSVEEEMLEDLKLRAKANPGLGIRIRPEHVDHEFRSMDKRTFAVERLGIGDWPVTDGDKGVIDIERWNALADPESLLLDPVYLAFDVSPARTSAAISAAGIRGDELMHVETVSHRKGVDWVVPELKRLVERHEVAEVICDGYGPAGALIHELDELGVGVNAVNSTDYGRACGALFDLVDKQGLRHLGTPELRAAIKGAKDRPLGEAWAWARKKSSCDITPLVAATLSLWGARELVGGETSFAFA